MTPHLKRLEALARLGDPDAILALYRAYQRGASLERLIPFRQYIESAFSDEERRPFVRTFITHTPDDIRMCNGGSHRSVLIDANMKEGRRGDMLAGVVDTERWMVDPITVKFLWGLQRAQLFAADCLEHTVGVQCKGTPHEEMAPKMIRGVRRLSFGLMGEEENRFFLSDLLDLPHQWGSGPGYWLREGINYFMSTNLNPWMVAQAARCSVEREQKTVGPFFGSFEKFNPPNDELKWQGGRLLDYFLGEVNIEAIREGVL